MKKYEITFYYHTSVTVEVEAENEVEALVNAELEVGSEEYDAQIVHNVEEDADPDVFEIEDKEE